MIVSARIHVIFEENFLPQLCALSVYSTLEGQILSCHVDCQTVAEQGADAMFHVAHILKENIYLFYTVHSILFCCICGIIVNVSFTLL